MEPMEPSLGERIRLSRKDLRLTQQQLADMAGMSRSYVNSLENGITTNIGSDFLIPLARSLGVSSKYLLGETANPLEGIHDEDEDEEEKEKGLDKRSSSGDTSATYTVTDPEIELLITIYRLLGPEKRKILLNMAKVLRDAETGHIIGTDPTPSTGQDTMTPPT